MWLMICIAISVILFPTIITDSVHKYNDLEQNLVRIETGQCGNIEKISLLSVFVSATLATNGQSLELLQQKSKLDIASDDSQRLKIRTDLEQRISVVLDEIVDQKLLFDEQEPSANTDPVLLKAKILDYYSGENIPLPIVDIRGACDALWGEVYARSLPKSRPSLPKYYAYCHSGMAYLFGNGELVVEKCLLSLLKSSNNTVSPLDSGKVSNCLRNSTVDRFISIFSKTPPSRSSTYSSIQLFFQSLFDLFTGKSTKKKTAKDPEEPTLHKRSPIVEEANVILNTNPLQLHTIHFKNYGILQAGEMKLFDLMAVDQFTYMPFVVTLIVALVALGFMSAQSASAHNMDMYWHRNEKYEKWRFNTEEPPCGTPMIYWSPNCVSFLTSTHYQQRTPEEMINRNQTLTILGEPVHARQKQPNYLCPRGQAYTKFACSYWWRGGSRICTSGSKSLDFSAMIANVLYLGCQALCFDVSTAGCGTEDRFSIGYDKTGKSVFSKVSDKKDSKKK